MKKIVLALLAMSLIMTCSKEEIVLENQISFAIERSNSDENFLSNVQSFEFKERSSRWSKKTQGNMGVIVKEVLYDVTLENGEVVEFGFWFAKFDADKDLLILDSDNPNDLFGTEWDYISSAVEKEDFYPTCNIRIHVNGNVIFTNSNNLNITNIETVTIDDVEKSFLQVEFQGSARGYYDPNGIHQSVYDLDNGHFKGIIE